jgi:hypothetical protein
MDEVAQVRMRNNLRASHDLKGEPHPIWLMQYYRQGRDQWMQRQEQRIARVRNRGNIYFAAKLERDLDKAKENARRVDHAYFNHPAIRAESYAGTREETTRRLTDEPRYGHEGRTGAGQADQVRPAEPRTTARPASPGGLFKTASKPVTRPGSAPQGRGEATPGIHSAGMTPHSDATGTPGHDPALDERGNRRDTGETFIISAIIDHVAADLRSTFPFRPASDAQGKDYHQHPQTVQQGEERRLRDLGEPEGPAAQPPDQPSRHQQEREERER